jgi:hypothetical protein
MHGRIVNVKQEYLKFRNCLAKKRNSETNCSVAPCGRFMKDTENLFILVWSTGIKPCTTGLFIGLFMMAKQLRNLFSECHPGPCPELDSGLVQDFTQ